MARVPSFDSNEISDLSPSPKRNTGILSPRKISNPMKSLKSYKMKKYNEREKKRENLVQGTECNIPDIEVEKPLEPVKKRTRKRRKKTKQKKEENIRRLRTFTESSLEIKKVLEKPPEYSKKSRVQYPVDVYESLADNLFGAIGLDKSTKKELKSIIQNSKEMKQMQNVHMCKPSSIGAIEVMAKKIALFSSYQYANQAALAIQTLFRCYKAKKEQLRVKSLWNNNRYNGLCNLIKREKTYVMNLATVVTQYVMPLQVSQDKQLKQIAGDLKLIFSNVEQILSVHNSFLDSLYRLTEEQWPELQGLGDLFINISPHWKAYGIYVNNFQVAREILFECINKNERFSTFLDNRTIELSTDLNMLLSLPLNHIAGYALILKNLIQETEDGSQENTSLLQALYLTEETQNFIGNSLGKAANIAKIERVKRIVTDLPPSICIQITESKFIKELQVEFIIPNVKKTLTGVLFIFENRILIISTSNRGYSYKHSFFLGELTVRPNPQENNIIQFLIIDEERPAYDNIVEGSEYSCIVGNEQLRDSLMKELKDLVALNQLTRTFGVPLQHIVEREECEGGIPRVIRDLITYLDTYALDDMGLFRVPGTSTVVKKLRNEYNQSFILKQYPILDTYEGFRANDAAGLLKMFFHDLPEPLIPYTMFNEFLMSQLDEFDENQKVLIITNLVNKLPIINYRILEYLVGFMVRVVANQEVNKMGAENLAMCFGPNVLRPAEQTIESTLSIPKTNGCIALMIIYFDTIFSKNN